MISVSGRVPTLEEYMHDQHDIEITGDITMPCIFHNEKSGKSLSFKPSIGKFRCFGKCSCGGDVYDLHKLDWHLRTKEEAILSLKRLYNVNTSTSYIQEVKEEPKPLPSRSNVRRERVYNMALRRATTPDLWVQLDQALSEYPLNVQALERFLFDNFNIVVPMEVGEFEEENNASGY